MRRNNLPVELLFLMVSVVICSSATGIQGRAQASEVKAEKNWQARRELSDAAARRGREFIYHEEKVPDYTLPEPLVMADGTKVAGAEMWRMRRRPEILELFRKYVYGRAPVGRPKGMTFKVFDLDHKALNGLATRKQVTVNLTGKEDGPSMDILIYLPGAARKPVPTFVLLNFGGNHTIHPDPAIRLSTRWMRSGRKATEQSRGKSSSRFPVEKILSRGYALATIYYGDIDPDYHDGFKNGVHPVFDKLIDGKRPSDAWGSICAWAWGLSRAMDYFESDQDIDQKRVVVLGHSRLGKTSLWAGARDERFALVISNNSGCGGAALSRRRYGESVKRINTSFPHWFCDNFKKYNGKEDRLPVDQHMLIALMAPRPVYVASADEDLWADPRGEFLSCKNAEPVYDLLGRNGLDVKRIPALNSPIQKGRIGYHIRTGGHGLTGYDWQQYMDFADRHFEGAEPSSRVCDFEPAEGKLESFLSEPKLNIQQVHNGGRFPNILVSVDGTVLALWGGVKVRRSEDGGETWGPEITVGNGFMGGGAIVNESNGEILAFVEKNHPPAPLTVYRSKDHGKTWSPMESVIKPDTNGNVPSMHMNEHGITLRHGKHAGRLIRAARHYAGRNHRDKWPEHYTTAIYSDDGGKTWNTSKPFAEMGTGEAAVAELSDGRLYYNSRSHWNKNKPPLRRRCAFSADGGETWTDWQIVEILPDGPQNTNYGCMGGLVRLPIQGKDILIYSNCDSLGGRNHGTVWASFDGGKTWPLKRLVHEGSFAYSSLTAGRPATKSEGWIYLHFESGGSKVARFNLSWLLKGEKTGDGELPKWLSQ